MKSSRTQKTNEVVSTGSINVIGEGTVIEGNLNSKGDIRIDGKVKGVLNTNNKVVLGVSGSIEGDVIARSADISGHIKGNINIKETLFLKSTARVFGDIETGKLVIESGSEFNGKCSMGNENVTMGRGSSGSTVSEMADEKAVIAP